MKIYNDEVRIKIFPVKNRNLASVKVYYCKVVVEKLKPNGIRVISKEKIYDKRKISKEDYIKIVKIFSQINAEDLRLPRIINNPDGTSSFVGILDGGNNSIILKENSIEKEFYITGISKEYHNKFYETLVLILKASGLDIYYID